MLKRCYSPKDISYKNYGGRGISVCARWRGAEGFVNFLADLGERPDGMSLDRERSNENYEPGNVRWATAAQQARNRRRTARTGRLAAHQPEQIRWLRAGGMLLHEIATIFEVTEGLASRIVNGKVWR